ELAATATDIHDQHRLFTDLHGVAHTFEDQTGLLIARDDPDPDPQFGFGTLRELRSVACIAQGRGSEALHATCSKFLCPVFEASKGFHATLHGFGRDHTFLDPALAQVHGLLFAVDHLQATIAFSMDQ